MLSSLHLKNFALIKEENIDFCQGLNILLGETGSGKSLIFDAIGFVLGEKSDKSFLRYGEDLLKVDAVFLNLTEQTADILKNFDIESDELVISRSLNCDGKSNCKINGTPVTISMLKTVAKTLMDSLIQHEGMELLKTKNHLSLVDKFGKEKTTIFLNELKNLFNRKKEINKQIVQFGGNFEDRERKIEFLNFQINEIEDANLNVDEEEDLKQRLEILSNAEKIFEVVKNAEICLQSGQSSAILQILSTENSLNQLLSIDSFVELKNRLLNARFELEDIAQTFNQIANETSFDEIEFNNIDKRMDIIKTLKRKFGGSVESVLANLQKFKQERDALDLSEEKLFKLNQDIQIIDGEILNKSIELSSIRKFYAKEIEKMLIKELEDLGMKNTIFNINFIEKEPCANGIDDIEFVFSANKGQQAKSVSKTASGGEISRLMLALKIIFYKFDDINSLLFDEVDTGISGEIGNKIADKLAQISKSTQIICISHLPQVVCRANHFYKLTKTTQNNQTFSNVNKIDKHEQINAIATLIGGNNLTEASLKFAKELLEKNQV